MRSWSAHQVSAPARVSAARSTRNVLSRPAKPSKPLEKNESSPAERFASRRPRSSSEAIPPMMAALRPNGRSSSAGCDLPPWSRRTMAAASSNGTVKVMTEVAMRSRSPNVRSKSSVSRSIRNSAPSVTRPAATSAASAASWRGGPWRSVATGFGRVGAGAEAPGWLYPCWDHA